MGTVLEQTLPVIVKKPHMEPFGLGDGYDESEADPFYLFYEPYDSSTGGAVFGGTTEDPSTKTGIQITGGACAGTLTGVNHPNSFNNSVDSAITVPVAGGAKIQLDMANLDIPIEGQGLYFYVYDPLLAIIFRIQCYARPGGLSAFRVFDKAGTEVAEIYSVSGLPSPVLGTLMFEVNLTTKLLNVTSSDWTLANNTDIPLGAGGTMISANIKNLTVVVRASPALESTVNISTGAIIVYPL